MSGRDVVPFERVLELLESHGYRLSRIIKPFRVFMKPGRMSITIPVVNGSIRNCYVDKIKEVISNEPP